MTEEKMKPTFKNMIMSYSGKCDGLVYCYSTRYKKQYVRKYVVGEPTAQNGKIKAVSQNLKSLNLSTGYKQDLFHYTERYMSRKEKDRKNVGNWYNVFTMIMWAMAKQLHLDLATLTREQIETDNLPCRTVKQAVEAELIPPVLDYEWLTNQM
jgi:hypothetical protein